MVKDKTPWYAAGLHFECNECGGCCSGPGEGYIWVTKPEIEFIAEHLKMTVEQLRQRYMRRVGLRTTIIEEPTTKDCIFLTEPAGQRGCAIYPVRPSQCRSWPFWPENLKSPGAWNKAAQKCPGINRGRLYSFEEIERIKRCRKWWQDTEPTAGCSKG
ncbi:MAG: YkgJ family cysteine cluster protein [Planctomycetota bacterium]